METFNIIHVGIAEVRVSSGENILRTILGSCVAICLYDKITKVGGLAHIMLPSGSVGNTTPGKYADTALPLLVKMMENAGSNIKVIKAKIAGGAKMFDFSDDTIIASIGANNIDKVEQILGEMGIELLSKDVGGGYSRIINFNLSTGEVKIRATGVYDVVL